MSRIKFILSEIHCTLYSGQDCKRWTLSTYLQTPETRPISLQDSVGRRPDVDDGDDDDDDGYNEPIILPP